MFERPQEEPAPIGPSVRPTRALPQTGFTAEAAYAAQRSALPEEDIGTSREAAETIRSVRSLHTRLRSPGAQTASRRPPTTANENLGEPYREYSEYQQNDNGGAPLPADALIPLRSDSVSTVHDCTVEYHEGTPVEGRQRCQRNAVSVTSDRLGAESSSSTFETNSISTNDSWTDDRYTSRLFGTPPHSSSVESDFGGAAIRTELHSPKERSEILDQDLDLDTEDEDEDSDGGIGFAVDVGDGRHAGVLPPTTTLSPDTDADEFHFFTATALDFGEESFAIDDSEGGDIFMVDTVNITEFLGNPGSFYEPPHFSTFPARFGHLPQLPHLPHAPGTAVDSDSVAATYGVDYSEDDDDALQSTNDVVFGNELMSQEMEHYNCDFAGFCKQLWDYQVLGAIRGEWRGREPPPHISAEGKRIAEWSKTRPKEITDEDVEELDNNIQGIQWEKLELSPKAARRWRKSRYLNYRNIEEPKEENLSPIKSTRDFYSFRRLNVQPCRLKHFQLRNILSVVTRNDVFFSTGDQVIGYHPITSSVQDPLMDLTEDSQTCPLRISTLSGCGGKDSILIAGGFDGTYALKHLDADTSSPVIFGSITTHDNGITNHIQLTPTRHSCSPHAVISSNDEHIRILDIASTRFIAHHPYDWAVNCSATSPDSRLRVVVGDSKDVLIVDAERGRTEFALYGHQDFGFATAWSDDGFTIATGNQDQTVRIYDARHLAHPLKVFSMQMAGCRTLRFSPIGNGGKRVLVMAEPADLVHIVDAVGFGEAQTLTFWGEVGGVEFTPDGDELVIANCDRFVGGLMTYGRKKGGGWYQDEEQLSDLSGSIWNDENYGCEKWKRMGADLPCVFV